MTEASASVCLLVAMALKCKKRKKQTRLKIVFAVIFVSYFVFDWGRK